MATRIVPITTPISNAYLLVGERIVVVDTLAPGNAKRILGAVEKLGRQPQDVSLILLTHGHGDHIGSADELRSRTNALVAMHWADLEMLQPDFEPKLNPIGNIGRLLTRVSKPQTVQLAIDMMLDGNTRLDRYGVDARAIETPGHTPGSVSVLVAGGQAIVSDLLRGDFFWDGRPDYPFFAEDLGQLHSSLRNLVRLPLDVLHPGVGKPFTLEDMRRKFIDVL